MFKRPDDINKRPAPFEFYTAAQLWADEYISERMLEFHLNGDIDVSSRRTEFIDRSVEWISDKFRCAEGIAIADFGCGSGLYCNRLALKGADVTGIDFSKRSVEYARKTAEEKGVSVDYVYADYLEFDTDKRFDLIMMIMCDLCALSPVQRAAMLNKFASLLKPDGKLLFDVYSLNAFAKREEKNVHQKGLLDGFWSRDEYDGFLNVFKYENEKVVLDKYTIVEADRERVIYNWLQYFSPQSL